VSGLQVFFNESWDHDTHINLSYFCKFSLRVAAATSFARSRFVWSLFLRHTMIRCSAEIHCCCSRDGVPDYTVTDFTFASLNNTILLLALAPELKSLRPEHFNGSNNLIDDLLKFATASKPAKVAFHAAWASPVLAIVYLQVYGYKDKPHWVLGVYEHAMSFFQIICAGVALCSTMQEGTANKVSTTALLPLEHEPP